MGLLDFSGFVGDDTAKDEFGMTQADRRQPLFTGLLKAGMLGMAAGENITPGQRAQLMGQVGGAIGDIPEAMNRNRAEAAQMQIRRQQFQEGARKNADRERIRALAQTPQFQEAIKAADPAEKLAIQAAIDSGDIGALNTAVGNIGKTDLRQQNLSLQEERLKIAKDKADLEKTRGGMAGTGERQQLQTWLMTEPPDSQRYARAYDYFSKEQRHNENGVWITQPAQDLEAQGYPKPSWTGRPGGTVGGAWPPPGAPAPGQSDTNQETGLITETSADGKTVTETDPKTGVKTVRRQGQPSQTEKPKPASDTDIANFHKFEAEAATILKALEDYQLETTRMSGGDRLRTLAEIPTAASMATALTQLLSKSEALLHLGVLTGDDMKHIQRVLPDPATFKGSVADYALAAKKVSDIIKFKTQFREKQVFPYGRPGAAPTAPAAGGGGGGGAPKPPRKNEKGEYVVD